MLHLVQSVQGYVSPGGRRASAPRSCGLTKAEVGAVATFYTMYKRRPTGRHLVSVCTNTLCGVLGGAADLWTRSATTSASHHDETTADGSITLEHAECLAACDYAPVVTVDYEFYDQQDVESARELVAALRRGEKPAPTRGAPLTDFKGISRQLAGFSQYADAAAAAAAIDAPARCGPTLVGAAAGRGARREPRPTMPAAAGDRRPPAPQPARGGAASSPATAPAPPSRPDADRWPTGTTAPTRLRGPSRAPSGQDARRGRPDMPLTPVLTTRWGADQPGGWPPTSSSRATPPCARRCAWRPTSSSPWSRTPACAAAAAPASRPA